MWVDSQMLKKKTNIYGNSSNQVRDVSSKDSELEPAHLYAQKGNHKDYERQNILMASIKRCLQIVFSENTSE